MTNNTQALASIDTDLLSDVQGGCGGRRRCCGCGQKNVNIVNNYGAAPAAAAPSAGPSVDVNVGYAQA
jgi:hypothetical protein